MAYSKSVLCKTVILYCVAQLFDATELAFGNIGGFPSNRSLHYNAISHDASHVPINMYRLILSVTPKYL